MTKVTQSLSIVELSFECTTLPVNPNITVPLNSRHTPCAPHSLHPVKQLNPILFAVHCLKLAPPMLCPSLLLSSQLLIDLQPLLLHMIQVLALEPDFIPYSWKENGEWQGLHVDIARQIALRNGFTPQFVSASWDELFVGIENGTYNLVLGIEPTEEREEAFANTPVNFTDIYYDGMSAMFNVKEFELSFSDWSEFKFTIKDMVNDGTIADLLATYNLQ